jgi:hypothetical protein
MKVVALDLTQLLLGVAVDKQRNEVVDRRLATERLVMRQPDSSHTGGVDAVAGELSERVQHPLDLPIEILGCHGLVLFEVFPSAEAQTTSIVSGGGLMKAPKIQRIGKKIPKKNIHPCPFRSVINPSVNSRAKYKKAPPKPIPHHIVPSL